MRYHVPADPLLLAAFGKVAIRHGHLEHALRMTMKTLAHLSVEEALDATRYESPANLRRRIRKVARRKLGEGQALLKLEALLERCNRATEKRNIFIHSLWARGIGW